LGASAGALLPLWWPGYPEMGAEFIVSVFAASTVGGVYNLYGAVLGGCLIGLAEVLGTSYMASWLGPWVIPYRPLVPLVAIILTLLLAPNGIPGVNWRRLFTKLRASRSKGERRGAAAEPNEAYLDAKSGRPGPPSSGERTS
ncbi:MAG: hypothetical protein JTT11_04700, partial [Candidatus Brockarchaeota archaeon]|nr:hypothetical protein [Candidatus Brockarchaeota archaeon]